jgi:2,3-bisphosphoglycerate-independent phosphoglycerate mutase
MNAKKVMLLIMDGWGLGKNSASDAIQNAQTPFTRSLNEKYPHTTLVTCGEAVGLPDGQMGNSEVGHMNLGAGRVVYQELQRINVAVKDGSLAQNKTFLQSIEYAKQNNKPLHLLGLVSDGGVHAHIRHLEAIIEVCETHQLPQVYIHAFTDGRDADPKSGVRFIKEIVDFCSGKKTKLATVTGRYYAMDRDKRWERVKIAYDILVNGIGDASTNITESIAANYAAGITDEFLNPILAAGFNDEMCIKEGDAVICFNFRTDRCREITRVLTQEDMPEFSMKKMNLHYTTLTEYDQSFNNVQVIFETDNLNNTLGEVLSRNGKKQIRIAETEKYPHVTFFFNGGREIPFEGEKRIMVPSPKVATYDLKPEMSAFEVTEAILPEIEGQTTDFICLNFANTDMVGHTGVWEAVIKAAETTDACVQRVVTSALKNGYSILLTADHGNADYMINEDGSPNTAHTLNLVPLWLIDNEFTGTIRPGKLGDIAPTILRLMELEIPAEMTGNVLI